MYTACYDFSMVHPSMPDHMLVALNEAAVEGLALVNAVLLRYYPVRPLYEIRPFYKLGTVERWKDLGAVLKDGWGDCKDFTAWRLAELRKAGYQARAKSIVERQSKRLLFHTFIEYPNGYVEDPAKELGMP